MDDANSLSKLQYGRISCFSLTNFGFRRKRYIYLKSVSTTHKVDGELVTACSFIVIPCTFLLVILVSTKHDISTCPFLLNVCESCTL